MMMETKTRTQRRMERKQALILLVLILIVSLSSFTLGVIVGRRGAERDMAQNLPETGRILVAEAPASESEETPSAPAEEVPDEEEKLTFYDNLSRGETAPLGSGINLPPAKEPAVVPAQRKPLLDIADVVKSAEKPEVQSAPTKEQVTVAATEVALAIPAARADGEYSVQVGSFSSVADAGRLKKSLLQKSYPVFIVEADLGAKGVWYRVRLGPFADAAEAKTALQIADQKDNIKGFVSRH